MADRITPAEALDAVSFHFDDLDEDFTLRSWLKMLLSELWDRRVGFDGKRPFGSSGWDTDLWAELIRRSIVEGELDEEGYVESGDREAFLGFVAAAIEAL